MVISVEESNTNPWQQAAQSMMSAGIGSLSGNVMDPPQNLNIDPEASKWNYNKAQVNMNEPIARELLRESYRMDQEQGKQNWFQDTIPTYDPNTWIVNSFNRGQPVMKAGITNPNLGGAKVWNASGPTDWLNYLKRFTPWYDPEQDSWRHEQYQKENPDLEEQTQEDIDEGKEKARAEWFAEYGTEGTGEYYPDKILRDAFPQSYPYLGDFPTGETTTPDVMDEPAKEPDIGPYTLEAQSQWKRPENVRSLLDYIMEKIGGDEPAARKYIFDNFGLKLPQLSLGVNRGGIIGLI